jgi:anti-sigma regulatory factor (Ser/Thr protein kinase)
MPELLITVGTGLDHHVVHASGRLSVKTAPALRCAVLKALGDCGRVVIDLTGLRLATPAMTAVFPAVQAAAGGWPAARIALYCPDAALAWALGKVTRDHVPTYRTAADALARLDERPHSLAQERSVDPVPTAPATARAFVADVCAAWGLSGELTEPVVLAANELVSNAVEHARSGARVSLRLDRDTLTLSVRDPSTRRPVVRSVDARSRRGRGVAMVERLADRWGVRRHAHGKTVWARFHAPL